jgi:hypothetical protein
MILNLKYDKNFNIYIHIFVIIFFKFNDKQIAWYFFVNFKSLSNIQIKHIITLVIRRVR